jgi:hypothetical protein
MSAVTLPVAQFWELRARMADAAHARQAVALASLRAAEVERAACALLEALGREHGFDPDVPWRCDDATLTIVPANEKVTP